MNDTKWPSEYMIIMRNILSYHIYNGLDSIYMHSVDMHKKLMEEAEDEEVPSSLKLFQYFLKKIENWNEATIEKEVHRIGEKSHQMSLLAPLLKACVKSYIIHMSGRPAYKCTLIKNGYHESVELNKYIHQCYIECAELFYNNPKYFYHKFKPLVVKKHQTEIIGLIKECVVEAVRRMVPLQMLLEDYLSYNQEEELNSNMFKPLDIKERVNVKGKMIMLDEAMDNFNKGGNEEVNEKEQIGVGVDLDTDVDVEIEKLNENVQGLERPKSRQSTGSKHSRHSRQSRQSQEQSKEKPKVGVDPIKLIPPRSDAGDNDGTVSGAETETSYSASPPPDRNLSESSDEAESVVENELNETIDDQKARSDFFSKLGSR